MDGFRDDDQGVLEHANQVLTAYGALLGAGDLSLGPALSLMLVLDGDLVNLDLDPRAEAFQLHLQVGLVPARGREQFYRQLLLGNYFHMATHGSTLSVDPSSDEVVLCRLIPLRGLQAPNLAMFVDQFISTAKHWNDLFASGQLLHPPQTASSGERAFGDGNWRA